MNNMNKNGNVLTGMLNKLNSIEAIAQDTINVIQNNQLKFFFNNQYVIAFEKINDLQKQLRAFLVDHVERYYSEEHWEKFNELKDSYYKFYDSVNRIYENIFHKITQSSDQQIQSWMEEIIELSKNTEEFKAGYQVKLFAMKFTKDNYNFTSQDLQDELSKSNTEGELQKDILEVFSKFNMALAKKFENATDIRERNKILEHLTSPGDREKMFMNLTKDNAAAEMLKLLSQDKTDLPQRVDNHIEAMLKIYNAGSESQINLTSKIWKISEIVLEQAKTEGAQNPSVLEEQIEEQYVDIYLKLADKVVKTNRDSHATKDWWKPSRSSYTIQDLTATLAMMSAKDRMNRVYGMPGILNKDRTVFNKILSNMTDRSILSYVAYEASRKAAAEEEAERKAAAAAEQERLREERARQDAEEAEAARLRAEEEAARLRAAEKAAADKAAADKAAADKAAAEEAARKADGESPSDGSDFETVVERVTAQLSTSVADLKPNKTTVEEAVDNNDPQKAQQEVDGESKQTQNVSPKTEVAVVEAVTEKMVDSATVSNPTEEVKPQPMEDRRIQVINLLEQSKDEEIKKFTKHVIDNEQDIYLLKSFGNIDIPSQPTKVQGDFIFYNDVEVEREILPSLVKAKITSDDYRQIIEPNTGGKSETHKNLLIKKSKKKNKKQKISFKKSSNNQKTTKKRKM